MKKTVLLAALLLAAVSCSINTGYYQDNLAMPLAQDSQDSLLFSVSMEYVRGGLSEAARDKVNATILSQAFDMEGDDTGSIEETAVRYRENLIDEYLTENGAPEEPSGVLTWEDNVSGAFTKPYKNWLNYLLTYYSFRGGAHGIQTMSQVVFDRKSGEMLTQEDFFAPDYEEPLAALLREAVLASMQKDAPELAELVEMDLVVPNGNFSVGKEGFQWIYQPYEVGPYALGIVMATLSWEQVEPYLK